jgi:NitT/TauT family transport system permease protein
VVVSTDFLAGGSQGIGTWMLAESASGTDRESVYAGTIVAGLLGLALNALFFVGTATCSPGTSGHEGTPE